ncbi:hypothetical protein ACFO7V_16440 [Glutamicibacter bergerei]|uniref:Secreted protein n=1 Tax=Glutamicibacter bergerei TaxID=256702 RepID=A0ABV9MRN8_9MICC
MGKIFKKAASVGAAILLAGTVLLSGAPANAGAQLGTIGQGSTYYPTASPYISYARVTQCMPAWGTPNMALVYQGRVSLGSAVALGPRNVAGFDGDSNVELRRNAVLRGTWDCLKKS